MAQVNRTTPLIDAQAGAAAPWGHASIGGNLLATAKAELRHGVNVDLGLGAFVGLDLGLSKFFTAEASGEAHAEIRVTGQVQIPLNLFEEIGLAVRLKAAAEAAAGVSLRVGIVAGDFLDLIEKDLQLPGLPARLALILLDEASFGGGLYAKAAASAMAYANLVVACRAVPGPTPQEKPGFSILAEMGAGLKAGAGFRVFFDAPIANFPKLVQRLTDTIVDEVAAQIRDKAKLTTQQEDALVDLFSVVAKAAFRVAFELGTLLGTPPGVSANADGAKKLALRCAQVIQEEMQRMLLDGLVRGSLAEMEARFEAAVTAATGAAVDAARDALEGLADRLDAMPDEPLSVDAAPYWAQLVDDAVTVAEALHPGGAIPKEVLAPIAAGWSGIALTLHVLNRLDDPAVRGNFSVGNLTLGTITNPFIGDLRSQPPPAIKQYIESRVQGHAAGAPLTVLEVARFVAGEGVQLAAAHVPVIARLLDAFQQISGSPQAQTAFQLFSRYGPIVADAAGHPDEKATMRAFVETVRAMLSDELEANLFPIIRTALRDEPELTVYFDEAIVPSIDATFTLLVDRVDRWDVGGVDQSSIKELASAVVLGLLGRSLVVFTDAFVTLGMLQAQQGLFDAADHVVDFGLRDQLARIAGGTAADDVAELAETALRVAGDVFGPLSDESRRRIRQAMFKIVAPLPVSAQAAFADQLADAFFVPNQDALDALRDELATIAGERFQLFVQGLLLKAADMLLQQLEEFIRAVEQVLVDFVAAIDRLVRDLAEGIAHMLDEIRALGERVEEAFTELSGRFDAVFSALGADNARHTLAGAVADELVDRAVGVLGDNGVYRSLPGGVKASARSEVKGIIRTAIDQEWIGDIAAALLNAKGDLDQFMDDVRELDPSTGLASGIAALLLDRLEDSVRALLPVGGVSIGISFPISWSIDVPYFDIGTGTWKNAHYHYDETISLGHVELSLNQLWTVLRNAIAGMQVIEAKMNGFAAQAQQLLGLEQQLADRKNDAAAASEEHVHAQAQQRDEAAALGDITIAAPAAGQVIQSDCVLEIALAGVPESWLGLGQNQQQHLHIWLNDAELDVQTFEVHGAGSGGAQIRFVPGSSVAPWGNRVAAPVAPVALATAPGRIGRRSPAHAPPAMGKPQRAIRVPKVAEPRHDPLTLRRALRVSDLRDGINTVVVVMVDGKRNRRVARHAFFAARPLTTAPETGQPKLPPGIRHVTGAPAAAATHALLIPKAARGQTIRLRATNLVNARGTSALLRPRP